MVGLRRLCVLFFSTALVLCRGSAPAAEPDQSSAPRPVVRVTSPRDGTGFLMQPGSEAKLLVTIEITDAGGSGIETDDTGTPKFYEPDDNVDLFRSDIVARGTYMNHLGQTVTQLTAEIPARDLKISKDKRSTPPFDVAALTEDQRKKGFTVPPEGLVDLAEFRFQVRDRNGAVSTADADLTHMLIGIAWRLYAPPSEYVLPDEESKRALAAADELRKKAREQAKDPLAPALQTPAPQKPAGDR